LDPGSRLNWDRNLALPLLELISWALQAYVSSSIMMILKTVNTSQRDFKDCRVTVSPVLGTVPTPSKYLYTYDEEINK
jgi:hypothetical protein